MSVLVDDIHTALTTESVIGGATGWTGYKLFWPDDASKAVLIQPLSGPPENTSNEVDEPRFAIFIRGAEEEHEDAQTQMQLVINTLDDCPENVGAGYALLKAEGSGYNIINYDSSHRAILGMTFKTLRHA